MLGDNSPDRKKWQAALQRRLRKAERHLIASDPKLAAWIDQSGKCQLVVAWERSIYEALVRAIAYQQLHGKAAASILNRMIAAYPGDAFPSPNQLARARAERLRSFGFSNAKVVAIQGIAAATVRGQVPSREEAQGMSDDELIACLLPLRGVGRWTVEMLLIFTLGRLDVMPVDDFGVQSGLQHLHALELRPKKKEFAAWTDHWSPYRSVAAWYLWRLADARKVGAPASTGS